ncbi:hypothetical protein [Fibrella aquatica]|uniref:hypothetical protein n=1 Tax=Fibrella aquatica TaxID=3242487 RepID=UPI0035221D6D
MYISIYLLFYGCLLLFYDFLAFIDHSSLVGLKHFRRLQEQIGNRQAHWALRLIAFLLVLAGLSIWHRQQRY